MQPASRPRSIYRHWSVLSLLLLAVIATRPASAVDPVTALDCQPSGGTGIELDWTNPTVPTGSTFLTRMQNLGPIGYWRLGEASGSVATDEQGLSDGIYTSNVTYGFNGAVLDDSDTACAFFANSFVEVPHDDDMLLASGSVAFWVYPHTHDKRHGLFSKDSTGFDTGGHLTVLWENAEFIVRLQSTSTSYFVDSDRLPDNCWYHVAFTWGQTGMRLYIDGDLVDTNAYTGGLGSTSGGIGNFEPISIAANTWNSGNQTVNGFSNRFDGRMDEVALFDYALSDTDVRALTLARVPEGYDYPTTVSFLQPDGHWRFEETVGTVAADETGTNPGTYSPGVTLGLPGATIDGLAPEFDGATGEMVVSDPTSLQLDDDDVTVACWFNVSATPAVLFSLGGPSTSSSQNTLYELEFDGDRFYYRHERSSGTVIQTTLTLGATIPNDEWHHVAIIKNERRRLLRLFVDGEFAASGTYSEDAQDGDDTDLFWGTDPAGNGRVDGLVDEGVVFLRSVSAADIAALANAGLGRSVIIERDGVFLDELPGTAASYTDTGLAPGTYDYCVTYTSGGVESTAECCTVTTLQAPTDVTCTVAPSSVDLTWTLGDPYTTIVVRRNGVDIATLAGTATAYSDASPPPGSHTYEVAGLDGTGEAATICSVDYAPAVTALTCDFDRDQVTLDWTNAATYSSIDVIRDGSTIATLSGGASQYVDSGLGAGSYVYEVIGHFGAGSSFPASCSGTIYAAPSSVTCCSEGNGEVELCWVDTVGYDAVEVYRDGTLVAAPTAPPCYVDAPGPGTYTYTLVGLVSGQGSIEASCSTVVLAPPSGVGCTQTSSPCDPPATVDLTWTNNSTATSIEIVRDGTVIATLGGTATAYTDTALADGTYSYLVRPIAGDCSSESTFCVVDVTSETEPVFTTQPMSQTVCPGATVAFSVATTGTAPIALQWRKDGVDLAGETGTSLLLLAADAADAGSYDVAATNNCGTVISATATLTVDVVASATIAGPSAPVCDADPVTFTATPSGTAPVTLQWQKDGVDLAGETNSTLSIAAVAGFDAGSYTVVATNGCGSAASNAIGLVVLEDVAITAQPAAQDVCEGTSATFTVATTGSAPISYQWRKDGVDISGATNSAYTIPAAFPADLGSYSVQITNDCSAVTSAAAALTLKTAATATIAGVSSACEGTTVAFTATPSGTNPVALQWRKDGVDLPGETAATLSIANLTTGDSGSYDVVATNECGTSTSNTIVFEVRTDAAITVDPVSQEVCAGNGVTFAISASGSSPLTIQWRKDSVDIAGATSSFYSIPSTVTADAGVYDAVVTNDCATVTSAGATLTVQSPVTVSATGPVGFVCEGASVTFTANATGTAPIGYQWQKNGVDIAGATSSTLTIASAVAADSGAYTAVASNSCNTETSNSVTLDVRVAATITSQPTSQDLCEGDALTLSVAASGTAPVSYQWQKDGVDIPGATSATYAIASTVASDAGSYAAVVMNDCATITSNAASVTVGVAASVIISGTGGTVCEGTVVTYTATPSGTGPVSLQWRKDGVDLPGEVATTLNLGATTAGDSGSYDVVATNTCGAATSTAIVLDVATAATIDTDPISQEVCAGNGVTFAIAASGSSPLTIQWRKDGVDIAGATSSFYSIPSTVTGDAGVYDAVVTNDCATVASAGATLTVQSPVAVSATGPVGFVCEGASVTFTANATGTAPIGYQWQKNGVDIAGATSSTLSIASAVAADSGAYTAVASNSCNTETSNSVTLDVRVAATITSQPTSQDLCEGDALTLSVVASGTAPISYQWQKDGVDIPGATSATYAIASTVASDAGSYAAVVMNDCVTITSNAASVTVGVAAGVVISGTGGTVCEGTVVTYTAAPSGTGPVSLQWRKDGVDLPGEVATTLNLGATTAGDSGSYDVVATNTCGTATSTAIALVVETAAVITAQPVGAEVCDGSAYTLSVTVDGSAPIAYQWFRDGSAVAGATGSSLTIAAMSAAEVGDYTVEVSNACATETSATATLSIGAGPTITSFDVPAGGCEGSPVTLSVAATGGVPFTYEWRKDGVVIAGATGSTFTIAAMAAADAGSYEVTITNECGTVDSSAQSLALFVQPTIDTSPIDTVVCESVGVNFTVSASGTGPFDYQWRFDGAPIAGADQSSFDIAAASAGDAGSYDVIVTGVCGSVVSDAALLQVDIPPSVNVDPVGGAFTEADSVNLTVDAAGTANAYQWRRDGVDLPGETATTLTIDPVAIADAGDYTCFVSNSCGTAESAIATITVDPIPAPSDVTCCSTNFTVDVCWTNNASYDELEVFRDGTSIAIVPGTSTCYTDTASGAGSATYTVVGRIDGFVTADADCAAVVLLPVTLIQCDPSDPTGVGLIWLTNSQPFDEIQVFRDGALIATVPGNSNGYTDPDPVPPYTHQYEVRGVVSLGDCDSTSSITCTAQSGVVVEEQFVRGDANNDLQINIADAVFILAYQFTSGPEPGCFDAGDANDDGTVDVADGIWLTTYFFNDGPQPPEPFPSPGLDPTPDGLDCQNSVW